MRRSSVVFGVLFLAIGLAACDSFARAQVTPSATGRRLQLFAGAEGAMFQPDYAGQGVAQSSPNKLFGIGAYIDADFTRWIQIEAQGRWLHWNQYAGIDQNTYQIGPRVPIYHYHGLTPYGKFLIGWGSGSFLTGRATALTFGGGVDYRLNRKFTIRAFNFEYQDWRTTPALHPYGGSIGLAYRVF